MRGRDCGCPIQNRAALRWSGSWPVSDCTLPSRRLLFDRFTGASSVVGQGDSDRRRALRTLDPLATQFSADSQHDAARTGNTKLLSVGRKWRPAIQRTRGGFGLQFWLLVGHGGRICRGTCFRDGPLQNLVTGSTIRHVRRNFRETSGTDGRGRWHSHKLWDVIQSGAGIRKPTINRPAKR